MTIGWQEQLRPGAALQGIVKQATAALVAMDADRLEELARCCVDLNREIEESGDREAAAASLRQVAGDLDLLERVLYETRANLTVLTRLHAIRLRETFLLQQRHGDESSGKGGEPRSGWSGLERKVDYGDN